MESASHHYRIQRCDVSRGLVRVLDACAVPLDPELDAPPFVMAFALEDPTSLPKLAIEALWVLHNIECCIEKGEKGAYIKGLRRLYSRVDPLGVEKSVIFRREPDYDTLTTLQEMRIQLRILTFSEDEHFLLLVVYSPLAFSLRLAAHTATRTRGRADGMEARNADERRRVWTRLAMHVRGGVPPLMEQWDLLQCYHSMDWMQSMGAGGFTCLFSYQMAMDWITQRRRRAEAEDGSSGSGDLLWRVTPAHEQRCMRYDRSVEAAIALTYANKKKKKAGKKRKNREEEEENNNNNEATEDDDEGGGGTSVVVEPYDVTPNGALPSCTLAMNVLVPKTVEMQTPLSEIPRTFPESVMLRLLQWQLHLDDEMLASVMRATNSSASSSANNNEEEEEEEVDLCQLLTASATDLRRPMLANGDATWGNLMGRMASGDYGACHRFIGLAFALAYTRTLGSDTYFNARIAAYGRYMHHKRGELSRADCKAAYCKGDFWRYILGILEECNESTWRMRPCNLFLFVQLLVADLMLCLNFHGGVFDGATNGIGATVIVRNGGGNYRRWFKDANQRGKRVLGQEYCKSNGTGADFVVGEYKDAIEIRDARFAIAGDVMSEIKRTSEMSLVSETCNTYEGYGSDMFLIHFITNAMVRHYSTELKAGNDESALKCLSAIAWLVTRNTTSLDANRFTTTRPDERTKRRVTVEYRQVIYGYWVLCSNQVQEMARERFRTLAAVTRTVTSAAAGLEFANRERRTRQEVREEARQFASDGRIDRMMQPRAITTTTTTKKNRAGHPLFFGVLGTALYTGFMQWTGMLGNVRETRTASAVLSIFYAQMGLLRDLLNPDMAAESDRMRFYQVSKARGMAMGLLGLSARETLESGRRGEGHKEAVERTALALKAEGGDCAVSWVIGDTLEHMLRLDFILLMLMLCRWLEVPYVPLDDLIAWLQQTGNHDEDADHPVEAFYRRHANAPPNAVREGQRFGFAPVESATLMAGGGMYITHPALRVPRLTGENDRGTFCERIGAELHARFLAPLHEHCQISENAEGDEIVAAMLECTLNHPFAWPSLLGTSSTLGGFHHGEEMPEPTDEELRLNRTLMEQRERLVMCPVRMIYMETRVAQLGVDLRWLLLIHSLCKGAHTVAQSARFTVVSQLVQRFYAHCVPNAMVLGDTAHFVALPGDTDGSGFQWPQVLPHRRRLLRRPPSSTLDGFTRSRFVEDMGAAAPRYELADLLGVDERSLPDECVHYRFPCMGEWVPVLVDNATPGAVRYDNKEERFELALEGHLDEDITGGDFLGGRVRLPIRPTCAFYRPGILVVVSSGSSSSSLSSEWGVVGELKRGTYVIYTQQGARARMTPYEIEASLVLENACLYAEDNDDDDEPLLFTGLWTDAMLSLNEQCPDAAYMIGVKRASSSRPERLDARMLRPPSS